MVRKHSRRNPRQKNGTRKAGKYTAGKGKPIRIGAINKVEMFVSDGGFDFTFEPIDDSIKMKRTSTGYEARYIAQDEMPSSPDEMGDTAISFLVNYHDSFDVRQPEIVTEDEVRRLYQGEKIDVLKDYYAFKIDSYVHSGVRLAFAGEFNGRLPQGHARFDVSSVGAIFVSKTEVGGGKAKATKFAQSVIEEWNQYLSGDVYLVVKETFDKEKRQVNYDVTGGYYGEKYALESRNDL